MPLEPIQGIEAKDDEIGCPAARPWGVVFYCTLLPGHEGDHEAGTGAGNRVAFWPQAPQERE